MPRITALPKKDIDSFLSESINPKIDNRLLIATTDGLAPNAVKVIKRQNEVVPVHQAMLTNLLDASIEWPLSLDDLSTGKVKQPYTPKPYQQTAIDEVVTSARWPRPAYYGLRYWQDTDCTMD